MKLHASLIFLFVSIFANAQDVSVEKSTTGIQMGILGVWVHNEARISNEVALRTEVGLDSGIFMNGIYDNVGFFMAPVITLEPRWYYNLEKRNSNSKNISGNSGNFLSLKTSFNPDWFVISNHSDINIVNQLSVIPTWGIRRNVGKHFTYETGIGLGYRYIFYKSAGFANNESNAALNIHLRIGYQF